MSDSIDFGQVLSQEAFVGERKIQWHFFPASEENVEFIKRLSTDYHRFKLSKLSAVDSEREWGRNALLSLQQNYFELLEFGLSIFFASIQSPSALPVWMSNYRTNDLSFLVKRMSSGENIPSVSKSTVEDLVTEMIKYQNADSETIKVILKNLLKDYRRTLYLDTYNSIKHGNRALPSDFNFSTSKRVIEVKCGVISWRLQELYKHEVDIPSDVKKAYYLEQFITPISGTNIYAQNIIIISWIDILISALRGMVGLSINNKVTLPHVEEVKQAWKYPNEYSVIVATPDLVINGKKRVAKDYEGMLEAEDISEIFM